MLSAREQFAAGRPWECSGTHWVQDCLDRGHGFETASFPGRRGAPVLRSIRSRCRSGSPRWAGYPLLVRAIRSFDVPGNVKLHLHLKQRDRGFDEATYVESAIVLQAVGGKCVDDLDRLREYFRLEDMLGHAVPNAEGGASSPTSFTRRRCYGTRSRDWPGSR